MPYQTDERLKGYLDTNQLRREQMCLAVLAIDKRFANVTPRHPRGGRDGGRDIEATFRGDQKAFGAVGFVNQANDSNEHKKKASDKFDDDVQNALDAEIKPSTFVFFTNVNLTVGEKEKFIGRAKSAGLLHCEIFDRERIRIALDSADGFAIRFQYLDISLSEPEQASFFAKWGDDIQSIISTGFQRIEKTLERVLFLQEAADVLSGLTLRFELDKPYPAEEIGHFRAFCILHLKEPKLRIFGVLFGSSDKSNRMRSDIPSAPEMGGIKYGISGGQWEQYIDLEAESDPDSSKQDSELLKYEQAGSFSGVGMDPVEFLWVRYSHDDGFFRFRPRLALRDIDEASFLPVLNKSLAEKLKAIHVYANGYKLQEMAKADLSIDIEPFEFDWPVEFTEEELSDPWVRIRHARWSTFSISFSDQTPRRLYTSRETPDSLSPRK